MKLFNDTDALKVPVKESEEKKAGSQKYIWWFLAILSTAVLVFVVFYFFYPIINLNFNCFHISRGNDTNCTRHHEGKNTNFIEDLYQPVFILNPVTLCGFRVTANESDTVGLLVMVTSQLEDSDRRDAIRQTWGSCADWSAKSDVRLAFVIGMSKDDKYDKGIVAEFEKHGDILQVNVEDTDENQTLKSVSMLRWVSEWCPQSRFFLKVEDTTYVNVDLLMDILEKEPYRSQEHFVGGQVTNGLRPTRHPGNKHFVSYSDYPQELYPPHVSGSAYVTRGATVTNMTSVLDQLRPVLPMENVYLTGLGAARIGANLVHDPRFGHMPSMSDWSSQARNFATANGFRPVDMQRAWSIAVAGK